MDRTPTSDDQLRAEIRSRYAQAALQALGTEATSSENCCGASCCSSTAASIQPASSETQDCCGSSCCSTSAPDGDAITSHLYDQEELGALPLAAALASRGCGNPTALANLKPGQRVLDLGSGGGIDVLLSAKRVGPTGFVYGLDMTDEMLALAELNRAEAGAENVRFLKGFIEAIPLSGNSIDVIISNCVINLSADKRQVLHEAFRVLAPGGQLAISDIVFQGQFPPALRVDLESWSGCIAGALEEDTYRQLLAEAGFTSLEIEVTRRYSLDEISESGARSTIASLSAEERQRVDGKFVSAFIRAHKSSKTV